MLNENNDLYYEKYLKYKQKYLELKQKGSGIISNNCQGKKCIKNWQDYYNKLSRKTKRVYGNHEWIETISIFGSPITKCKYCGCTYNVESDANPGI